MNKHTPGPWEIAKSGRVYSLKHGPIADVLEQNSYVNARLIAAAPDLLAACEVVAGDIEGYLRDDWDGNTEGWTALLDQLRIALAKGE